MTPPDPPGHVDTAPRHEDGPPAAPGSDRPEEPGRPRGTWYRRPLTGTAVSWPVVATWVVVAATLLVRCWTRLGPGGLFGTVYDESVVYQAATRLLAGSLPYQDYSLVHPPGSALVLLPFALFARVAGDAAAMAAIHVFALVIAGVNAYLLCVLLRRFGTAAVIVGGMLYAWYRPVVAVDQTFQLEPSLNLLLLLALVVLFSGRRHGPLVAGLLLGLSCTIKVWAVVDAVVLGGYLLARRGRREAARFAAGYAIAVTVVCLPFFLVAPRSMIVHVLQAQASRPRIAAQDLHYKLGQLNPLAGFDGLDHWELGLAAMVVVTLLTAAALVVSLRELRSAQGADVDASGTVDLLPVACALLVARGLLIFVGATFYRHYAAFPAVPFCLVTGILAGRAVRRAGLRAEAAGTTSARVFSLARMGLATAVVLGLTAAALGAPTPAGSSRSDDRRTLQTWAAGKECVWGWGPALVLADAATPDARNGCRAMVDRTGTALYLNARHGGAEHRRTALAVIFKSGPWQRQAWREIQASDALVLDRGYERWLRQSRFFPEFSAQFEKDGSVSGWTLWSRR